MNEGSHISPERIERSIQSRFNPLANLSPARLTSMLEAFNAGYLAEAARTWDAMLRRDDRLPALVQKRLSSVARYGFDVVTVDVDGDARQEAAAKAHAEKIEFFLNHLTATNALDENERGGFSLLVRQMASAIGMRYAVHEIVWQPMQDGLSAQFRFVPLWFFENRTGKLRFLEHDYGITGIEMPEDEWLVTVGPGLMEASSVCWMYKRLPLRDWLAYSQKFGFPGVLGKTSAAKGTAEWTAMEEAVRAFLNDFGAVCNSGESLELIEAKAGSSALPFEPLIERMDKALAIMWRGGDLGTASGTGADSTGASLQGDETDALEQDDAAWLSEVLQTSVIRQVIEYHFGIGTRPLAYVQIRTRDRKDTKLDLEMFKTLSEIGVPISVDSVLERFGLQKPRPDEELLKRPESVKPETGMQKADLAKCSECGETFHYNSAPEIAMGSVACPSCKKPVSQTPLANELSDALGVPKDWTAPVADLWKELIAKVSDKSVTDADLLRFLDEAAARLPELFSDMDLSSFQGVLESALGAAVLDGARQAFSKKS